MRRYFDSNIYARVAEQGSAQSVREYLDRTSHRVTASHANLSEAWRVPTYADRIERVSALTVVAAQFLERPVSYLHAQELLHEVRRCRPDCLIRFPSRSGIRFIRDTLKKHRQLWPEAKRDPAFLPERFGVYEPLLQDGIARVKSIQKGVRETKLKMIRAGHCVELAIDDSDLPNLLETYDDAELWWRYVSMIRWYEALFLKDDKMRDYYGWISPYIRPSFFAGQDYLHFWLVEVSASNMPYSRLARLAWFYQIGHKVTSGNPMDIAHANHLVNCDAFLTADKDFHNVLVSVRDHFPGAGIPVLVQETGAGILIAIREAVTSADAHNHGL